jgi:hypothetical protein
LVPDALFFADDVLLAPEVLLDRDVDLEPPLLACGISPSWIDVGAHTILLPRRRAASHRNCKDHAMAQPLTQTVHDA